MKKDDIVWDYIEGYGRVISINKSSINPIRVAFKHNILNYRNDGRINEVDLNPRLFYIPFKIPEAATI